METPTTEQVKKHFVQDRAHDNIRLREMAAEVFEFWLRDHDAEVLERAARDIRKMADHGADGEVTPFEFVEWLENRALKISEGKGPS